MSRASHAPNGEDVRAWRALRDVAQPFYVEVALGGDDCSSWTAGLDAEGWRGLVLLADGEGIERLREARPAAQVVHAVAQAAAGAVRMDLGADGASSCTVPAARLADLLRAADPPDVHVLLVHGGGDVAGLLVGLDVDRWRPWVLCLPAVDRAARAPKHAGWELLLRAAGYSFVAGDGLHRWYLVDAHADRAAALAEPFGAGDRVVDGWVSAEVAALRQAVDELAAAHRQEVDDLAAAHGRALVRSQTDHARQLAALTEQLTLVAADRDAVLERERIMLGSKSWAVTGPLRRARLTGWLALQQRRSAQGVLPRATSRDPDGPGDARRRAALEAKVRAAHRVARR